MAALAGGAIGAGLNFVGGILHDRAINQQRDKIMAQVQQAMQYLQGQGIQNPEQYLQASFNPVLNFSQGVLGGAPDSITSWLSQYNQDSRNYLDKLIPQLTNPGNLGPYFSSPLGDNARGIDELTTQIRNQYNQVMNNPAHQQMRDIGTGFIGGQDQALAALLNGGNTMVDNQGTTGYNMNALDTAGGAISRGGNNNQTQGIYDRGQSLFDTGGYSPNLQALSSQGLSGMGQQMAGMGSLMGGGPGGMQSFMPGGQNAYSQNSMLGPQGNQAISQLLSQQQMPQMQQGAYSPQMLQNAFSQFQGGGYTPQNSQMSDMGTQGMQQLLNRNGDIDSIMGAANQAFTGNLPGGAGGDTYGNMLQGLIGQLGGISVGGGGGASGASAGSMGPMDPTLAAMLAQGAKYFAKDPLMSLQQRVGLAADDAMAAGNAQAERAQAFARARGGGGAIVNSGSQNQAYADFADQIQQSRGKAIAQALLDQQQLGLTQQMQGAQVGLGAANADTSRQQVAASRDIASANNATSASVANAQMSQQAAMANAQLRSAALQAGMQGAVAARGQNYGQSQAGLQAMLSAQGLANQRGQTFTQAALGGLDDATKRYQSQLGILPGLAGAEAQNRATDASFINNWNQNRIQGAGQAGQLSLGASNSAGQLNSTSMLGLGQLGLGQGQLGLGMGQLGLGAENAAAQRAQMGLNAMGQAGQLANANLNSYGNIGNQAMQDQLSRIGLGSQMLGQNINSRLNMFPNLVANEDSQNKNANSAMANWLQGMNQQAGIYSNMFGMDLGNRQLGQNAYSSYLQNNLGYGSQMANLFGMAVNPLSQMAGKMVDYQGNALGQYGSTARGMLQAMPGGPAPPWPQINLGGVGFGGMTTGMGGGGYQTGPAGGPMVDYGGGLSAGVNQALGGW